MRVFNKPSSRDATLTTESDADQAFPEQISMRVSNAPSQNNYMLPAESNEE
jgi:hypothetical protein